MSIRVLIVEDSPVVQEHLRRIISADPRLEVVGIAASGEKALELVEKLSPDVISMDIQLPGMQGFEATRRIMSTRPTPIVVVSGIATEEINLSMEALKAGALAAVEKPVAATHEHYVALADRLCTQLAIMSEVKVVRQRAFSTSKLRPGALTLNNDVDAGSYEVLGIAASTGGPNALLQVLTGLGHDFPLPIAIVQHMTMGFISGFADWLGNVVKLPVSVVTQPTTLLKGRVYLASSEKHLVLDGLKAFLDDGPSICNQKPSANPLFTSMAHTLGSAGIGVVLTGMGEDGAAGLRDLRLAGGFTIAESESTAVVYGMPAAAVRMGAAIESLPLGDIAERILKLVAVETEIV
jgi:two-component system chemotaxis response regulator CheB